MFSPEQKREAVETFIRFDHSYADTIAELGYPSRATLRLWWKDYQRRGEDALGAGCRRRSKYTDEQRRAAVDYYLEHGRSLARTMRRLGFPKSREYLCAWIDELAPGERKRRASGGASSRLTTSDRAEAAAALESRDGTAAEVAEAYGVSRTAPYRWRRQAIDAHDHNGAQVEGAAKGAAVRDAHDGLPDDVGELRRMALDLKGQVRKLQMERDVLEATVDIIKKDPGADPNRLTNAEKELIVRGLRGSYSLKELLGVLGMAKSSYEYARRSALAAEGPERAAARKAVVESFNASNGTYGYRRVLADVTSGDGAIDIGEWSVRAIMREEGLKARAPKRKRRYSSYQGEISEAPANTCLGERGRHDFGAKAPNELWVTDVTEFSIPAGKAYLSPIIDCFDGCPISWSISTSPDAEMANSSLLGACAQLREGEHPRAHSDRGCHYRWPGWITICAEHGIVRSMSRKGCSPDNSRAEGFFGRLKVEFFFWNDWEDVTMDEFIDMLDAYLRWYRDVRLKSDLGYMSPKQYRESLGLAA